MKKVRVDFSAHVSVVVGVNESDDMYDRAVNLAQNYVDGNPSIYPCWEPDDGGVDYVDEDVEVSVFEK